MRRMLLLLLLIGLIPVLPAHAQAPPAARITQMDTSNYPEITLYLQVTDAAGKPVNGLDSSDFAIQEDGQAVTIADFAGGGASQIKTVLVIDRSGSMDEANKIEGAREAARAFVAQMRPGDQTAVIVFDSEPQLIQSFTSDKARLDQAIRRIDTGSSTALYDSLIAAVDQFKEVNGRKALLLLTDGRDCYQPPCDVNPGSDATLDEAIAYAGEAGQPVQVIGLGEREGGDERTGIDEQVLQRIADETHGSYFYAPSSADLERLYRQLSQGMQQEYRLTYQSPRPFYDGTYRNIEVFVGQSTSTSSGYLQANMINVQSDPFVGILLLLPILALLLLPRMVRRRRPRPAPVSTPVSGAAAPALPVANGATISQLNPINILPGDTAHCQSCDAALLRPDASFCSACGAVQARAQAAERRIFCDQCGKPMRLGARFCSACGATAVIPTWEEAR